MNQSLSKNFTFGSLLLFALPTTIMMIIMSLYTIVDGIFISRFVSTNALSSLNIVYPLINVAMGIGIMLSTGSNAIVARKMGQGDQEGARKTFTAIVVLNLMLGAAVGLSGALFAVPLSRIMGASDLLLADCVSYLRWQMAFVPALMLQVLFQMFFVTEGRPGIGLFLTLLSGICNVVLDYVLIVPLQLGIAGAAMATVAGYMVTAVVGLIYFAVSRRSLWLVPFRFHAKEILETCVNGSSEMVSNLASGIITFLFNLLMMYYAGEDGVAAITIIQYSQFLLNALYMGFSQGISPVIGFNYGSQNHRQLKQVFRTALIFIAATSVAVFVFAELAGAVIVGIFAQTGTAVYEMARHGFTIFAVSFLFSGLNLFSSALFTALSNGRISAIISFIRTFVLIVASLAVLPLILGLDGIWLAIPIAEAGATVMCVGYLKKNRNVYHYA